MTGWAGLRWRGANYFDGLDATGTTEVDVELVVPTYRNVRPWPGVLARRRMIGPKEWTVVDGLPVATVARALYDEIVTRDDLWAGVQALDMTAAARLISVWLFGLFVGECNARVGAPLVRETVPFGVDESLSPREAWQRMVWRVIAGFDEPVVNQPLCDLRGRRLGVPDLFDPVAALVVEYFGEIHRSADRHRKDVTREELFRSHGLEYVAIVRGDSRAAAAERMRSARSRAPFTRPEDRLWTSARPAWDPAPETLDDYFERTGQVERLIACDSTYSGSPLLRRPDPDAGGRPSIELPGA